MSRTSPTIEIKEVSGDKYTDLKTAQRSARVMLAFDLKQIVKEMVQQGALEVKNNKIIPKGK